MISVRNKSQRSSSNIFFNKQNNYDFANKLHQYNRKNIHPSKQDPKIQDIKSKKTQFPLIKKTNIQPYKQVSKSQKISLETDPFTEINFRQTQNQSSLSNYSKDILNHLLQGQQLIQPKQILLNHTISKQLRSKMVDWMIEVLSSYKYSENSFFTAVRLMDSFFMKSKVIHQPNDLHLTGVTCIFMATKYEQIYPLKLKVIYQKIAHKKISKQTIIKKESQILLALNFDIVGVNNYDLMIQALQLSDIKNQLDLNHYNYLHKICLYLSKMVLYDLDLLNLFQYSTLAAANIYVAFKIIQQIIPSFIPDQKIKQIIKILKVKQCEMMESAGKVLYLAKNFQRNYQNLGNLKKYNGFAVGSQQFQASCRQRSSNQ